MTVIKASLAGLILAISAFGAVAQNLATINQQKPVGLVGGMELRGIQYNATGIANRRDPFTYFLNGSPTLTVYGVQIPFQFTISKQEQSFRQPFNRFGLSPHYRWITLHGGHRNVTFSPYTLAGHTMLGGGVELTPGKLRVGAMYGRLNRATVVDTLTQTLTPFSFDRTGFAAKLGYGTHSNFFDLHVLKAKDDSTSALQPPMDVAPQRRATPAANTVVAYGTKLTFFNKLTLESDGAISLYTRDIQSELTLDDVDDPLLTTLKGIHPVNGSTEWYTALKVGVGYIANNYGIQLGYHRVDPEFKSMGAYFFANDVENYTIAPRFSLPDGRLHFNGSLGIERDNVNRQKQSTSKRVIGSASVNATITKRLGLDVNYSNYSNNQRPNTLVVADSLKIVQTTQTLSIMPRYQLLGERLSHVVFASFNFNGMSDFNTYFGADAPSRNVSTKQYMLNYTVSVPRRMLTVFTSLSYTDMVAAGQNTTYKGGTLGGNYSFAKQRMRAGVNASIMQGNTAGNTSLIFNGSANVNIRIDRLQSIGLSFFAVKNNPGSAITGASHRFTETRGELAYQLTFGL